MLQIRHALVLAVSASLAACAADTPLAPVPQPLPALQSAVWHVNVSDGQTLPALLGHRMVNGNVLEQDFLDSAQFVVNANGSWEHRGWYQRFRNGEYHTTATTFDFGSWVATTESYEFRRSNGELIYLLPSGPSNGQWQLNLRYPNQDGVAVSQLRTTRPPASIVGQYRATALNSQPLPHAYFVEPEFDNGTALVSHHVIIDSAKVWIRPNGRYQHSIYFSHWEGPVNGAPQVRLIRLQHHDFGSWKTDGAQITLESGWLQNHVIRGERALNEVGPMHLNHGISHGDEPVPLRYVRF